MNKPESSLDELHAQIMNLPRKVQNWGECQAPDVASHYYAMGHRDARHAAAELVAAQTFDQVLQEPPDGPNGPEFTDWGRAAILSVLWHHQGGSSDVGQPLRFALGKGAHEHLSEWEVEQAKKWEALPSIPTVAASPQAVPLLPEQPPESRWQRLYTTVNELMVYMGANGSADAKGDRASAVMDALHAIDGGTALPEQPIAEQPKSDKANDLVAVGSDLPPALPARVLDRGFKYENGVHTPTVLVGFPPNDWDSRDAFAAGLAACEASAGAVPSDKKYLPAASLPVSAPAGVRMLFDDELWEFAHQTTGAELFSAIQRKFCEVNGLKLAAATTKEN